MPPHRLSLRPIALIWALSAVILLIFARSNIQMLDGWDPDDRLRLVQLRDLLAGQSWFDTTQYRMNPPNGAPMHWNRLIELPLAAIIIPLSPIFGAPLAERIAAAFIPLLCLGLAMVMMAQIATRLAAQTGPSDIVKPIGLAAATLVVACSPALTQLLPMRIDHHGWQLVLAVLALWAMGWTDARYSGLAMGAALALWLAISIEGLPLAMGFFAVLGGRWVLAHQPGTRLFWALASLSMLQPLLYLATRGLSVAGGCDIIGPGHIAGSTAAAVILMGAIFLSKNAQPTPYLRGAAAIIAAIAGVAALLSIAPQCGGDAFASLDPLVREYWYLKVQEGLPIWRQDMVQAVTYMGAPIMGVGAFLWLLYHDRKNPISVEKQDDKSSPPYLVDSAIVLMIAITISWWVFRAIGVAALFAVPFQAILAVRFYSWARAIASPFKRIMANILTIVIILPGAVIANAARVSDDSGQAVMIAPVAAGNTGSQRNLAAMQAINAQCDTAQNLSHLRRLPTGNIIAPLDISPGILMATSHRVLASSHHRNDAAMHDQIEIFRQPPTTARKLIQAHDIHYIVSCPAEAEMMIYAARHPQGLWGNLAKNADGIKWLEPIAIPHSSLQIWWVRDSRSSH